MKKLFRSPLVKLLPGLLVRLSSVWLLAAFATLYFRSYDPVRRSSMDLKWPALFFAGSLIFSILLFYWEQWSTRPAGPTHPDSSDLSASPNPSQPNPNRIEVGLRPD